MGIVIHFILDALLSLVFQILFLSVLHGFVDLIPEVGPDLLIAWIDVS